MRSDRDILGFRPGIDSDAAPLVASTAFAEEGPALSPDGRWLAYSSNETGRNEVFLRPFPNVDSTRVRVSTDVGIAPLWAKTGDELFYWDGEGRLVASDFDPITGRLGSSEALFAGSGYAGVGSGNYFYDVSADGEQFLMARPSSGASADASETGRLILVQNFFEELREVVPD